MLTMKKQILMMNGLHPSEKVYFGYNLTDIDALSSDDPSNAYTKVGPWIYNVTSHKEVLEWNDDEGTMTYLSLIHI